MQLVQAPTRRRKLISLTPLIDVVFILLLFFMLTSTFLQWRSVDITNSSGETASASTDRAILLRILDATEVDISGARIPLALLPSRLAEIHARRPDIAVTVEARDEVPLQVLIDVLDTLSASGIASYGMVTR